MESQIDTRAYIPEACRGVDVVVGIDEAGRGCVLGSLVYAAAFWPSSCNDEISSLGFDDSKVLKEEERDKLFDEIKRHPSIGWIIQEIEPEQISQEMLKPTPVSLNKLSYDAVVSMLTSIRDPAISEGRPPAPKQIFVDTVGDPEYYRSYLERGVQDYSEYSEAKFTVEKKADAKYRCVSAASIIAKVTRDRLLRDWRWREGGLPVEPDKNFGSGYPSDETCVAWLERNLDPVFGFPSLVRHSWSTSRDLLQKRKAAEVHWECDDDGDAGGSDIKQFFAVAGEKRLKRCSYFNKLKLRHVLPSDLSKTLEKEYRDS